jgi:hypothetical protein
MCLINWFKKIVVELYHMECGPTRRQDLHVSLFITPGLVDIPYALELFCW